MARNKKKYIPSPAFNHVLFDQKLNKLGKEIDLHKKSIDAISKSHDLHISYLGNFARHDIKNTILSMDSILTSTDVSEFTEESKASLILYLDVIRTTIDNFAKLVPYSSDGTFTLMDIMVAIELLSRADMQTNDVKLTLDYDRAQETAIKLPFQMIIQMINNLIINAIRSLEGKNNREIHLKSMITENDLVIEISDNGIEISDEIIDMIFEYGFSTCGGSGIGLFHTKYLCEQHGGSISIDNHLDGSSSNMTKCFCVKLPIEKLTK